MYEHLWLDLKEGVLWSPNLNECTCSAEPSPQVWFGKQEWFSHWQENNCRQYLTVIIIIIIIILYVCVGVCVTNYTPSPTSIRSTVLKPRLENRRKWNKMGELTVMAESLEPARSCSSHYFNCTSFQAVIRQR